MGHETLWGQIGRDPAMPEDVAPVPWEPWSAGAFARAAAERKPVLLSLTASWCHGCAVMDATTYADSRIRAEIAAGVVPVRVDADRRPDINARYNLDGWPTTALLTPSGEILTGSTYLTPDAMLSMLVEGGTVMRERYDELMARAAESARQRRGAPAPPRYEPDGEAPRWVLARMFDEEDREHGGFGAAGKFLPIEPLRLALACVAAAPNERLLALLVRTLDAASWRGLFDEVDGGFFRYAAGRDFTRPHTEKLLEDQLAMIGVLLDAARLTGRSAYAERALDVVRYVQRTLSDGVAFFASQQPDAEYYALNGTIRASMDAPAVDRTVYTDLNAQAIVTWLKVAEATGDARFVQTAERTAAHTLLARPVGSEGLGHWSDPQAPRALLTDQIHGLRALVHLFKRTGRDEYLARARDVGTICLRRLWDQRAGGFVDRAEEADDLGLLLDRRKPLRLNSLAARALHALAASTGSDELRVRARETLGAITGSYRSEGLDAAPYALAVLEVVGPPAP
jgi:uncharacterized protein YyaL (SSP411 family)